MPELSSGLDRDDGQGGRLGTPTPANSKQYDSTEGHNVDAVTVEEMPDSPTIERAEQATLTKKWNIDWNEALTRILTLGRGAIEFDSFGNATRVLSATIQHKHGDVAELTKVSEGISFDSPPDKFRITAVKLDVNIMKHPRYFYALQGNDDTEKSINQSVIRLLQNYFDNPVFQFRESTINILRASIDNPGSINSDGSVKSDGNVTVDGKSVPTIPGTNFAKRAAIEIVQKYWLGIETPYVVGLQVEFISYYFRPPFLNLGGYVENPMTEANPQLPDYFYSTAYPPNTDETIFDALTTINPQCYSQNGLSGGPLSISWLREADTQDFQRTWFEVTRTWIGSPVGFWDPQLYTNRDRPKNENDYLDVNPNKITNPILDFMKKLAMLIK